MKLGFQPGQDRFVQRRFVHLETFKMFPVLVSTRKRFSPDFSAIAAPLPELL